MKQITVALLCVLLVLSLAACGDGSKNGTTQKGSTEYTVYVGGADSWTPFENSSNVFFETESGEIISITDDGRTVTFTGLVAGEAKISAKAENLTATATISVIDDYAEVGNTDGTVSGWVTYFADELKGMSEAQQTEYLLSIGDYMALSLTAKEMDESFINMAEAATLLYPCSYLLNNYATLRMDMGDYEDAIIWLEKAREADASNPIILTNLAQCEFELKNYDKAMDYAGQAISAEPDYGLAHLVMTCVHLQQGNDELAIETLFKSIRTIWTDTSQDLMYDLFYRVREAAGLSEYGDEHRYAHTAYPERGI